MSHSFLEKVLAYRPAPDFSQLLEVLARRSPARPTLFEFFLNGPLEERLSGLKPGGVPLEAFRARAAAYRQAGYDYVTTQAPGFDFPTGAQHREATVSLNEGAMITDRASFERYSWPDPEATAAYYGRIAPLLPEGMKVMVCGPCGVLENSIRLVGYDALCFLLADDPALAKEIFDAVGSRLRRYYEIAAAQECVGLCISNDDWGFKTQPMLPPATLREYVFPWHKRIAAAVHAAGKPVVLHSCGNAAEIWPDIIDDIQFDGKHSYEDAIEPVEAAYERHGRRIAILGGMDLDFVVRSTPEAVHRRARAMLERSAAQGGYALGTGNSVPEYVPQENYAAMVWAALEARA
ncbi:MAG: uroporphyrinogen decarboxylase family protein [Lentisphaeria bacterium]|jgi:uroporphyrinogen decarboxylase